MKKPRVMFTIADKDNAWMIPMLVNSVRKFHSEQELPIVVIDQEKLDKIKDKDKFYKMTPLIARDLIKEYELVIKADCDQIFCGNLDYIFTQKYDVGTVYNWNRVDPARFGEIGLLTINPIEYFNCGLVALRSEEFINHWWDLCNSPHFERMPMREQGFLNVLTHYGKYKTLCFDDYNSMEDYSAWHGLRVKGEELKTILVYKNGSKDYKDAQLVLPVSTEGYPESNKIVKVYHSGGGSNEPKLNFRILFPEPVISYIEWLISDQKGQRTNK